MDEVPGGSSAMDEVEPDPTAAALANVIRDYGRRAGENPARLKAMLNDSMGARAAENRAAIDALVIAAEEGVPTGLAGAGAQDPEQASALAQRLTGWGLSTDMAAWAVGAWASALGSAISVPPLMLPSTSLPATSLPPTTVPPPRYGGPVAPVAGEAAASAPPVAVAAPTGGRPKRALVAAGVVAVLVAVGGTAYALSGGGDAKTAGAKPSSGVSSGPSLGTPGEGTPSGLPSSSESGQPSPSPTPSTVPSSAGSKAPSHARTPTPSHIKRTTTKAAPKPTRTTTPATTVPNPVASNWSSSYTVKVCGSDWCQASWPMHDGGTWDKVVVVSTSPGYGQAHGSGKTMYYWPRQNGTFTDYVKFYVMNSSTGQKSNVATFTVTVKCNTSYVCS